MHKVNIFTQYSNGKTEYRNVYCSVMTSIKELFVRAKLPTEGAIVFLEGQKVYDATKPLYMYNAPNPCFVSVHYVDQKRSQKRG